MTLSTPISNRPLDLPEPALGEILEAGFAAYPFETGGILFPRVTSVDGKLTWIAVLNNIADFPGKMMEFDRRDFIEAGLQFVQSEDDWSTLTVWHTHPAGGVGPSRRDMKNRIPQMGNLVIALNITTRTIIPTWF